MNGRVLVLNTSYEPINVCTERRAVVMIFKGVARVEEHNGHMLHSQKLSIHAPSVIRLTEYIHIPFERRSLSRELHDEVGQTLTALRVELGNLEKLRLGPEEPFRIHLEDAKGLTAQTLQSVRSLASGLRPSVLDDLGLGPALEWQARQFSRRTGIVVEVVTEDMSDELPEAYRTCLYRVVQEALTNCARHSEARQIRIAMRTQNDRLCLAVQDDGKGFNDPKLRAADAFSAGLGLVGIEERVHELGGSVELHSHPGQGTLLKVGIPLPDGAKV